MRYTSWLTLAFSASAIARPEGVVDRVDRLPTRDVLDIANLPAIKGTVEVLTKDGDAVDKAITALTKENAATQVGIIITALDKLSVDTSAQAAKIGKSGSIGILEISGLLSTKNQEVWKGLLMEALRVVNTTSLDIIAKKDITKDLPEPKLAALSKAIKAQKKGIMDIVAIMPGQVPPAVKSQLDSMIAKQAKGAGGDGAAPPKLPNLSDPEVQKKLGTSVDDFLDQVVQIVSGKKESFQLPAGVNLPAGINLPAISGTPKADGSTGSTGSGDMAGMPGMAAAPPATEAPAAAAAPKPAAAPKTVPKSTGTGKPPTKRAPMADYVARRI